MGQVYLAEDEKLGREVALKVLPPEVAGDADRLERFEREARTVASLNHPSIVTLHSIEESEGLRFITMERVRGRTLRQVIPPGGLGTRQFFHLAIPLADALAAAHQQGITHRDLKPDNVMVTDEGRVKVLDFGLAKARESALSAESEDARTASVTQDGRILGTVAYMSPEQAQGLVVDHRSDIFSLGILLYEMATGERPFQGSTNLSILSAILKDTPPPVTDVKADLPRPLARMVQRALEKKPGDRYQSAADLRQDLEDLKRDVETGEVLSSRSGVRALLAGGARGPASTTRLWLGGLGLVLALLAGLAVLRTARPRPAERADGRPSLAVFYFENLSGDPNLDWLRTGLTDMLVTDLSQSPGLRVLSTAQLYQLLADKGLLDARQVTLDMIQAVAREAHVGTALVGSFVRAGDTLRISARLQDTASGDVLSSERVEGSGDETIFPLVDDLTRRIKGRLALATAEGDMELKQVTTASLPAYRAYAEGERLHMLGQDEQAVPHLEKAAELDPNFAMALAKLTVVHRNLKNQARSRECGARALQHLDRLTGRERYYIEGVVYSGQPETLEKAMAAYQKAVELFPDHGAARNNLAQLQFVFRRHAAAIANLEELVRQGGAFPGTHDSLAEAYAWVGKPEKGLEVLQEYVRGRPDNVAGRLYLARYLASMARVPEARAVLDGVAEDDPDNRDLRAARFTLDVLDGRWAEALEQAQALERSSRPLDRWLGALLPAVVSGYQGRLGELRARFERAASLAEAEGLADQAAQARLLAGDTWLELGRPEEAAKEARRAAALAKDQPAEAEAHALAALALTAMKRPAEAAGEAAAARTRWAQMPAALAEVQRQGFEGLLALARGDARAALASFEGALPLLPRHVVMTHDDVVILWFALAEAERALGHDAKAEAWLERVAEAGQVRAFSPIRYVRSLYFLGELAAKRGDKERARAFHRRFLEQWKGGSVDPDRVRAAARTVAD
jgi:TolB-like protein/tetratricopeptide (TPR) repeat protein